MPDDVVPDLYRLAFIPGCFRCEKCGFQLSKVCLNAATGEVGTREQERNSEPCPNDGTIMVHVTYRERVEEYHKRLGEEFERFEALQSRLEKTIEQLAASKIGKRAATERADAANLRIAVFTEFASFVFSRGRDSLGRLCMSVEEEARAKEVVNRG